MIFHDHAKHTLLCDCREGVLLQPPGRPRIFYLSPHLPDMIKTSASPAHAGECVFGERRGKRKARERLTAFFFTPPPFSVGDTGEKRAADPGLNLECSLIRYYAICSRTLSPSNAAANLLSSPN